MKDPFSLFIEDSVYYSSNQYYKLMFQTKKLYYLLMMKENILKTEEHILDLMSYHSRKLKMFTI